jgi:hypothetical protein
MAAQTFKLAAEKLELKRQLDHVQTLYSDTKCDLLSAQAGLARALREAGGAVEPPTTSASSSSVGHTYHVAAGNPVEHVAESEQEARPPKRRRKECELGPARAERRRLRADNFRRSMREQEAAWVERLATDDPNLWFDPEI